MSRATAAVRFADDTVKWCLYNGTADLLMPALYDDPLTPWSAYYDDAVDDWPKPIGDDEPVTICSDYGGGMHWPGRATRNVVTLGTDPWQWDDEADRPQYELTKGRPDWFSEALDAARPPVPSNHP